MSGLSPLQLRAPRPTAPDLQAPQSPSEPPGEEPLDQMERGRSEPAADPLEALTAWDIPRPNALQQAALDVAGGAIAGVGALGLARALGKPAEDLPLTLHKAGEAALMGACIGMTGPLLRMCHPGRWRAALRLVALPAPWNFGQVGAFWSDVRQRSAGLLGHTATLAATLGVLWGLTVELPNGLACDDAFCRHTDSEATHASLTRAATLLTESVLGPLLEEALFRGVLLPQMHRAARALLRCPPSEDTPGARGAVAWQAARLGSSLAFGWLHVTDPRQVRWLQGTAAYTMGLIFADLSAQRGLLGSLALHAAWNGLVAPLVSAWQLLAMEDPYALSRPPARPSATATALPPRRIG